MSENEPVKSEPAQALSHPGAETQQQRWMKYGANVVLASVIVVLLAAAATYLAQKSWARGRVDTTQLGLYSLRPQTKAILKDLKEKVKIVSLYTQTEPPRGEEKKDYIDFATPVADLLEEYKRNSNGKIDIEVIDPTKNPSKVDDLITNVTELYGGEVKQYRDFLAGYGKTEEQLKKAATDEVAKVSAIPQDALANSKLGEFIQLASRSLDDVLADIEDASKSRSRLLEQKPPNYKGVVDAIRSNAERVSEVAAAVAKQIVLIKGDKSASEPAKKYAAEAAPRYTAIQKQADALVDQIKKLGSLKLDDLRQQLRARNGIVVLGPKDMRTLSFDQVWQTDPNLRRVLSTGDKKIKPQFAGEQQITSAILSLTQEKKPKIAFVRGGGPPLTAPGMPFFGPPPGEFSRIAARLREYNFDVMEKDLSGTWAMQAQMSGGQPPAPEPDDAQIKDAIWVVIDIGTQGGPMGPPPSIAPKVAEHVKAGGAALVLAGPKGDDLSAAVDEYGIKLRTDAVIVHEPIAPTGAQGDFINEAQRRPYVFIVSEYGKHMLAEPVRSLDSPLVAAVPVITQPKPGIKQWNLLPIPTDPPTWGETNVESLGQNDAPKNDPATDVQPPLFAGAAAQREQGEGRVVVLGNFQSVLNEMLRFPDVPLLEKEGIQVARFPGSMELFTNSVFWLAKMEPMIAISPAAMDVSRIQAMSAGSEWFWRNGVLLIGLPLLVILAGALMYVRRRD